MGMAVIKGGKLVGLVKVKMGNCCLVGASWVYPKYLLSKDFELAINILCVIYD